MRKKTFLKLLTVVLAVTTAFLSVGCAPKGNNKIIADENVLNVKIRKAGYGTDYIYALKEQFEKTFEAEGYKINVLAPREDLLGDAVYREIYSDGGIDVYFTSDIKAKSAADGDYGQVFAKVTDVYGKKPIGFDGKEEDKTVAEKVGDLIVEDYLKYGDDYYGLPFAFSIGGLAVNKKALDDLGLALPRTTKELFACADKIMEEAGATDVYPFTYALSGNNYPMGTVNSWIAQYGGIEEFDRFWSFQNEDGSAMTTDCYKVFEYDSVKNMFKHLYAMYDSNMSALGSGQQDFVGAQAQIMKGTAVFYCVGDWFLNEEYARFNRYVNDVTFINVPVVSELGINLFGAGTTYGYNEDKCEQVLTTILKYADENKTADVIKPLVDAELQVNIDIDDVTTVCERRGYVKEASSGACIAISEKSPKKDLAEIFLRFCASTDAGKLFTEKARTSSPYALNAGIEEETAFRKSVSNIVANPYMSLVTAMPKGYRKSMGVNAMLPYMGDLFTNKVYEDHVTKYMRSNNSYSIKPEGNAIYEAAAANMQNATYEDAKYQVEHNNWKVKGQ